MVSAELSYKRAPTPELHEVCALFPPMSDSEYQVLRVSIEKNGLLVPIETLDGKIIDGKNRLRACAELGIAPQFVEWRGPGSLTERVVSLNLERRHLTADQKAAVAYDMLPLLEREAKERQRQGREPVPHPEEIGKARDRAAKVVGVNEHYVSDFKRLAAARPDLAQEVRSGKKKLIIAKQELIRYELKDKTQSLPNGKFNIILADPPYAYTFGKSNTRVIENHYPTQTLEELAALPVENICADDCVLFLWVPPPKLIEGLQLLQRWGFSYKTSAVWNKLKVGMGYYFRIQHEYLLVGTRGNPQTPDPAARPPSIFESSRTDHSEKSAIVYELIEAMYPTAKKIELYARGRPRKNWAGWGNEVEKH